MSPKALSGEDLVKAIQEKFEGLETEDGLDTTVMVPADKLIEVATFLRDEKKLAFDHLSMISGVDLGDDLQSVAHLVSFKHGHALTVKTNCPRETPEVPTLSDLWPAANWHERETYDLMGITYTGHPDLRRILCAEDWIGHPLRKDYVMPDEYRGIANDFKQAGKKK